MSSTGITIESTIEDFREFQQDMLYPGFALDIMVEEDDQKKVTEFDMYCNELLEALAEVETSIEELNTWKNTFILQSVPSAVKLDIVILFARLFRSKSNLHQPLFDLIKQVRMYSRPWSEKRACLVKLDQAYHQNYQVLNVAIRKLENMQQKLNVSKAMCRINLWERIGLKMLQNFIPENYGFTFIGNQTRYCIIK